MKSRFEVNQEVVVDFFNSQSVEGKVDAIAFTKDKVYYDIRVPVGYDGDSTTLYSIDSAYVQPKIH